METSVQDIRTFVEQADMVLVGIGEEFERRQVLMQDENYQHVCAQIKAAEMEWLIPCINTFWLKKRNDIVAGSLDKLFKLVEGKNYFVVSTCMNGFLQNAGFKQERMVEPCGGYHLMQCAAGCEGSLKETSDFFLKQVEACCQGQMAWQELQIPKCDKCGQNMIFNSLYAQHYLEAGYLEQWSVYRKWLQGTVNRKLCILELGVGLQYPSVIRWPFEKTAYFNKKAVFVRVHEKLFQLTEELREQGYSLSQNAVEALSRGL